VATAISTAKSSKVHSISRSEARRRVAERIAAVLFSTFGAIWLGANLIKSPAQFFQAAIGGLSNGALYALIALGYTIVYGIIEFSWSVYFW